MKKLLHSVHLTEALIPANIFKELPPTHVNCSMLVGCSAERIKKGGALRASIYYFLRDAGGNKTCQSATFRSDRNQGTSNHLISDFYFPLKSAFCLNLKQVTEEGRKVENDFDFKMRCSCIYLFIGFYTQLRKWKNKRQIQNSNSKQKPLHLYL